MISTYSWLTPGKCELGNKWLYSLSFVVSTTAKLEPHARFPSSCLMAQLLFSLGFSIPGQFTQGVLHNSIRLHEKVIPSLHDI